MHVYNVLRFVWQIVADGFNGKTNYNDRADSPIWAYCLDTLNFLMLIFSGGLFFIFIATAFSWPGFNDALVSVIVALSIRTLYMLTRIYFKDAYRDVGPFKIAAPFDRATALVPAFVVFWLVPCVYKLWVDFSYQSLMLVCIFLFIGFLYHYLGFLFFYVNGYNNPHKDQLSTKSRR